MGIQVHFRDFFGAYMCEFELCSKLTIHSFPRQLGHATPGPLQASKRKKVDLGQHRPGPLKQARRKGSTWATVKLSHQDSTQKKNIT